MQQRLGYFGDGAISVDPLCFNISYFYKFTNGSQFSVCLKSLFFRLD